MPPSHPPKRQDVLSVFSTFLDISPEAAALWVPDHRLRRSAQILLAGDVTGRAGADGRARGLLSQWQRQPCPGLARLHLIAYLQESCYWAAWKVCENRPAARSQLTDLFQAGIVKVDVILTKFNVELGFGLDSYAFNSFKNTIRHELNRRELSSANCSSDWSLLRHTGRESLGTALRHANHPDAEIERYVLAWLSYQRLYVPADASRTRRLRGPDAATWDLIAQDFNRQRPLHLPPASPTAEAADIARWMRLCAEALRAYRPRFVSIDAPRADLEGTAEPLAIPTESAFDAVQRQEEREYAEAINQVLCCALDGLDPAKRRLLDLYHGEELGQKQIARQIGKDQGTVSRQLTRCRGELVVALAKWSQEKLNISLTCEVLKRLEAVVDEWLCEHYGQTRRWQQESASE
ncbi:sigma-70 family RNA polymerase sigma factor [Gloeobacter morelensis]|uniref:sigma-70 family RNA polymerase sigma factor n=1 Tax=Gloeobacter morelensis TaxID=2907343 RepID=UPI001E5D4E05|nr:sigma-70 family RNA polymerase sigma factor [Gloeobacter morelensis]